MINENIVPGDAGYDISRFKKKRVTTSYTAIVHIPVKMILLSGQSKTPRKNGWGSGILVTLSGQWNA